MIELISRLPVLEKFIRYWRVFRQYTGARLWAYIFISLTTTLIESVGIGLFFPLLGSLQGAEGPRTAFEIKLAQLLEKFGIAFELQSLLVCILVVFFAKAALQFAAGVYQSHILSIFLTAITKRVFDAVAAQEYKHFLTRNIGVLTNVVVNETNRAMVAFMKFATLFPSMISISIFGALAFVIDWQITVAALFFGFGVLLLTRLVARRARGYSYQITESTGFLNELVLQSFGAFKYLRSTFGMRPLQVQVERTTERVARTQFLLSATSSFSQALNEPVVILFLVAVVWQQTIMAQNPLAQVVVLALAFFRLIKEVMVFQSCWHGFSATMGSIDMISAVIRDSELGKERFAGRAFTGISTRIRFENVSFSYGSREVLRDLSLEIPRNSMIAVVGESGSGKSTFVDILTGILKPASGRVLLDDTAYADLDLSTLRSRIGYVTQEPALFNDTIANNISFWDPADPVEVRRKVLVAAQAANCREFVEGLDLGFDTVLGDRGVNLSGGQRQRVAISRELYKSPELLILDEATSALDSENEAQIQKSIEALKGKLTTVVIAHRLSTIRNADRIFVFSQGRLVEEGQFANLYEKGDSFFRRYCDLQGLR
jgi:ABC-type multidrug transport system fused ATPase/permease subunit